jgi:hypothetical protein
MANKKRGLKFVIFLLAIAGLVAYGYFYLNKDKNMENQENPDVILSEKNSSVYEGKGFSFKYPEGYKLSAGSNEEEGTVIIENADGKGFQITIAPFDEEGPITADRLRLDMPDAVINGPTNIDVNGTQVLTYYGKDEGIGDTFEAWIAYGGNLYQIIGYKESDKIMKEALDTWRWSR